MIWPLLLCDWRGVLYCLKDKTVDENNRLYITSWPACSQDVWIIKEYIVMFLPSSKRRLTGSPGKINGIDMPSPRILQAAVLTRAFELENDVCDVLGYNVEKLEMWVEMEQRCW
jgi:hypothetical protein